MLAGCGNSATLLTGYETALTVEDGVSREFHSSLYYPKGLALHYPGYLIGFQKGEQDKINGPSGNCSSQPPSAAAEQRAAVSDGCCRYPDFLARAPRYFAEETRTSLLGYKLGSQHHLNSLCKHPKSIFVAHVTRHAFDSLEAGGAAVATSAKAHSYPHIDSCHVYNAFDSPALIAGAAQHPGESGGQPWADLRGVIAWKRCPGALEWGYGGYERDEFFANGARATRSLGGFVARDLTNNDYTHVLVLVMGWNTAQDEAVRNFNDVTGNLLEAAKESRAQSKPGDTGARLAFRPLVIGVTWPSFWSDAFWNGLSYTNKANDADELGLSWLNLLVNEVLPQAIAGSGKKVPLVVVGHSFGGRAVARVVSASPALKRFSGAPHPVSGAALAVILQGAVSINRFWPDMGYEGAPLRDFDKLGTKLVFTASKHDSAAGGPIFWYDPSGSIDSYQWACNKPSDGRKEVFHCVRASDTSGRTRALADQQRWSGFKVCDARNAGDCRRVGDKLNFDGHDRQATYIDASDGITEFNTLGTGGNAHSDIYRLPMGRLLWMVIDSFAPAAR